METKQFPLSVVLSVTTQRLLTEPNEHGNGIDALYDILGWMTNDSPFTHQLPRFNDECKPWLLKWFPRLAELTDPVHEMCEDLPADKTDHDAFIRGGLGVMGDRIGQHTFDVPRIPADAHESVNPLAELVAMVGPEPVIAVVK